jgi:hypothetical protein
MTLCFLKKETCLGDIKNPKPTKTKKEEKMELKEKRGKREGINVYKANTLKDIIDHYDFDSTIDCYNDLYDAVMSSANGEIEIEGLFTSSGRLEVVDVSQIKK